MSTPPEMRGEAHETDHTAADRAPRPDGHTRSGHGWMMWLMCLPMVTFAIVLMTTSAGASALVPAILCIAMMAVMMGIHGRNGGH